MAAAYRQNVLIRELLGYQADIICLQELTERVHSRYIAPLLHQRGFQGRAVVAETPELAIHWRESRFSIPERDEEAQRQWCIGQLITEHDDYGCIGMQQYIAKEPHVAQAVALQCRRTGRRVIVVNTHLIMHTLAANVRAIQCFLILRAVKDWIAELALPTPPEVILCGDLNVRVAGESILALLDGRGISRSHWDWVYGRNLVQEGKAAQKAQQVHESRAGWDGSKQCASLIGREGRCKQTVHGGSGYCWDHLCGICGDAKSNKARTCRQCPVPSGDHLEETREAIGDYFALDLQNPIEAGMKNAYEGHTHGTPAIFCAPFRPATGTPWRAWYELKDHICYTHGVNLLRALPAPDLESLRGIPNLCVPSDHVALVADLSFAT